jgi:hypothetical protein
LSIRAPAAVVGQDIDALKQADAPRWRVLAKPYRMGEVECQLRDLAHFG